MNQWKKRYISTKFRDDKFIIDLDPIEKLLFMYFLTNPLTNVAWIYEISLRRIAFDTWIDKDMVQKIIDRFTESKKIYYIDWYIILANSSKHQNIDNAKIKKWIENVLSWLPKDIIDKIWSIYDSSMTYIWLSNNLDLDSDSNLDSDLEEETHPSRFIKPKIEEVEKYCIDRKNNIDAQWFIDFYESNWRLVWKNKMKDWKACIRTRESRNKNDPKKQTKEYEKKDARENFTFM